MFYYLKLFLEEEVRSFPHVSLIGPKLDHERPHPQFTLFLASFQSDYDEFCRSLSPHLAMERGSLGY